MSKASRTRTAWTAGTAVVATGLILPGLVLPSGSAYAAAGSNSNNKSVGSGNQVLLSLDIPADICGLAVAILGTAESGCQGGAGVQGAAIGGSGTGAGGTNTGNTSVASGNKVSVPVRAPISVCGVSIAILGSARSGCQGGTGVVVKPVTPSGPGAPGSPGTPGTPGWPGTPGSPGTPGWPGNPGGPSGPTWPGHHHKHHQHHKCGETHHTTTSHHGSTTVTSASSTTPKAPTATGVLASSVLPTTGANLAGLLAAALAFLGLGAGVIFVGRRRTAQNER
jgi:LPXTG-motif cell wall-anchored protein